MKRRVFVGSSHEALDKARELCDLLSDASTDCVLWNAVFRPGYLTFEALENMLLDCSAAVFVATADDNVTLDNKSTWIPRTNVMLEFGLVAGRLGRHNVAICQYPKAELPSDLAGLTVIQMADERAAEFPGSESLVSKRGEEALQAWRTRLLATAEMVARTDILHGYTGVWRFAVHLEEWRGIPLALPAFAQVNGVLQLYVSASGQGGSGVGLARVTFKVDASANPSRATYQGEFRVCQELHDFTCTQTGGLAFTGQTFALHKMNASGVPWRELDIDAPPDPWPFRWVLEPGPEPRTLLGTMMTESPRTTGTVEAIKDPEFV
jgi:hypothetical protein